MKKHRRKTRVGFTLIEVIAGLAIVFFLMGALMQAIADQSKYNEVATRRMSESQIARTLLHQMAEELKTVIPPIVTGKNPGRARGLLAMGDLKKEESSLPGSMNPINPMPESPEFEPPTEELPMEETPPLGERRDARGEELPPEGAERFGLLGTSNRLIMMVRKSGEQKSPLDQYREEEEGISTDSSSSGEQQDKRRGPARWGDQQQIYYLLRPLPEALEKKKNQAEGSVAEDFSAPAAGEEERFDPYYGGVLRQHVRVPSSRWALDEARFQLEGQVLPKNDNPDEFRLPDIELPSIDTGETEVPLPPQITTDLLTDRITAMRFRYHNGRSWQDAWDKPDELPVAVEISLSFEPKAADPEYLKKYFEERRSTGTGMPPGNAVGTDAMGQDSQMEETALPAAPNMNGMETPEPPLFPYRLVVALPCAKRQLAMATPAEVGSPSPPGDQFGQNPPPPPGPPAGPSGAPSDGPRGPVPPPGGPR